MDFFDFLNSKQDKPTAMANGLTRIWTFARLIRTAVEVFVGVALISWTFYRLPFALRISVEFLRRLVAVVASPLFVFLLGNVIVAALVARFRAALASQDNADEPHEEDVLYDEVVKTAGDQSLNPERDDSPTFVGEEENVKETVVYQDKEIIILSQAGEAAAGWSSDWDSDSVNRKVYRRAKSEKAMGRRIRENRKALRRCETTPRKGQLRVEEELSDEEFQRAVDDFIAKHRKLRREESLAMVLVNPNPTTDLV